MQTIEWDTFLEKGLPVGNGFAKGSYFTAMTVGVFDGVHRGHKALIERIVKYDKEFLPVIITFRRKKSPQDILSYNQKMALFAESGVAITVVAELTESFRNMKGAEFLRILRDHGRMGFLAVGNNFRCGHHRDTDASMIQELNTRAGVPTEIVQVLAQEGGPISSSRIRHAIIQGNLNQARLMLGRPFVFDLSDVRASPVTVPEAIVFDTAATGRVLPPSAKYEVLLHTKNNGAVKTDIQIEQGLMKVFIPAAFEFPALSEIESVEFL